MRLLHICCIYDSLYVHIIEATSDVSNYLMQFSRCFLVEVQTVVILMSVDGAQQTHHLVDVLMENNAKAHGKQNLSITEFVKKNK